MLCCVLLYCRTHSPCTERSQKRLPIHIMEGQISITIAEFIIEFVGTCDRARHMLPLVVCQASAEGKEVVPPFGIALHHEIVNDSML